MKNQQLQKITYQTYKINDDVAKLIQIPEILQRLVDKLKDVSNAKVEIFLYGETAMMLTFQSLFPELKSDFPPLERWKYAIIVSPEILKNLASKGNFKLQRGSKENLYLLKDSKEECEFYCLYQKNIKWKMLLTISELAKNFTIESLFLRLADMNIYDFVGGCDDLIIPTLRLAGDFNEYFAITDQSFVVITKEQILRIFNFFNLKLVFHHYFGIQFIANDFEAQFLQLINSFENYRDEGELYNQLNAIFSHGYAYNALLLLEEYGYANFIFPQFDTDKEFIYRSTELIDKYLAAGKRLSKEMILALLLLPAFALEYAKLNSDSNKKRLDNAFAKVVILDIPVESKIIIRNNLYQIFEEKSELLGLIGLSELPGIPFVNNVKKIKAKDKKTFPVTSTIKAKTKKILPNKSFNKNENIVGLQSSVSAIADDIVKSNICAKTDKMSVQKEQEKNEKQETQEEKKDDKKEKKKERKTEKKQEEKTEKKQEEKKEKKQEEKKEKKKEDKKDQAKKEGNDKKKNFLLNVDRQPKPSKSWLWPFSFFGTKSYSEWNRNRTVQNIKQKMDKKEFYFLPENIMKKITPTKQKDIRETLKAIDEMHYVRKLRRIKKGYPHPWLRRASEQKLYDESWGIATFIRPPYLIDSMCETIPIGASLFLFLGFAQLTNDGDFFSDDNLNISISSTLIVFMLLFLYHSVYDNLRNINERKVFNFLHEDLKCLLMPEENQDKQNKPGP